MGPSVADGDPLSEGNGSGDGTGPANPGNTGGVSSHESLAGVRNTSFHHPRRPELDCRIQLSYSDLSVACRVITPLTPTIGDAIGVTGMDAGR